MHTNTLLRAVGTDEVAMPKAVAPRRPARFDGVRNAFIPHPAQFPIRFRRQGLMPQGLMPWRAREPEPADSDLGLSFHSPKYIPAGTRIELEIPLRGEAQHFSGTVVMVRELAEGYEIGLWLASPDDATRARIVEQICHTECYLSARRGRAS